MEDIELEILAVNVGRWHENVIPIDARHVVESRT